MNMSKSNAKSLTVPEIAIIAATRGAIGFGAGLLLADKFRRAKTESARLVVVPFRTGQHDPHCDARLQKEGSGCQPAVNQ
jgi:hypothetical protein